MSTVIPLPLSQPIREEASVWIAKLERGLHSHEREALSTWASQSQVHHETLMKMASLWDSMGVLTELSSLFPLEELAAPEQTSSPFYAKAAMAASIVFCLGIGGFWMNEQTAQDTAQYPSQYLTAVGEHSTEHLADGSVVKLNTNSLIKIEFTADERHVTLVRGEAHFEVAHAPERPFIVQAGAKRIRAVGTAFNVHIENDRELEVLVTEGKVLLTNTPFNENSPESPLAPTSHDDLLLVAGEKVAVETSSLGEVEQLGVEDLESELAWQQGFLVFEGEELNSVLEEVSRYSDVSFELADPALTSIRVAGFYKARDVDGLLLSLKENFDIHHEISEQNHITLSPR